MFVTLKLILIQMGMKMGHTISELRMDVRYVQLIYYISSGELSSLKSGQRFIAAKGQKFRKENKIKQFFTYLYNIACLLKIRTL